MNETPESVHNLDDYRTLADAIPQIIWSTHDDGSVEYFNRGWFAYTGQTEAQALRSGWTAVLHPADVARTAARWHHSLATHEPYEIEYRLRAADGTFRWFVGRGRAVTAADGTTVKWYGSCTDVDDLKCAEEAIRANANTFRRLADSLPQIVWTTNSDGKNTFLNGRWFSHTGADPSVPHDLGSFAHPDDYPNVQLRWNNAVATGAVFEMEFRIRRLDGVFRWFLVRAIPVRTQGDRIIEWFGSCTDIDDQKRAQAEMRAAYERERRIATTLQRAFLTHDLPQVPGLQFHAVYRPAEREAEVGGDWYDAIAMDDGRILISIGDVAGHGLDAAVVMGNIRQAIRVVSQLGDRDPATMLDIVDRSLRRESPDVIVTAFIGIIDAPARRFAFATAGHPPPLLYSDGTVRELSARGLPLGLREGRPSSVEYADLPETGVLVLYTDGLIEATRDIADGERRLREALVAADGSRAANPAEFIQERVLVDGARDDVAVLSITIDTRTGRASAQQVA